MIIPVFTMVDYTQSVKEMFPFTFLYVQSPPLQLINVASACCEYKWAKPWGPVKRYLPQVRSRVLHGWL